MTLTKKLEVVDAVEREFTLRNSASWEDLKNAIAMTKLESARSLMQLDATRGLQIARQVARSHADAFRESISCFPPLYQRVYALAGFRTAEFVASAVRLIRPSNRS